MASRDCGVEGEESAGLGGGQGLLGCVGSLAGAGRAGGRALTMRYPGIDD